MSDSPSIGPAHPPPESEAHGPKSAEPVSRDPSASERAGSREALRSGAQLNGIFEIDAHVASGGMGEVYKGHSIQTGDAVAIKVIRADFTEDETAISLFRKEAAALFNLHHEAIVRYFIFTVDSASRRAYLAMEFVDGELLSKVLKKGPMPIQDVCLLGERLALGLYAAHEQGIVHRDVAPDNIIIQNGDVRKAKIIDFGIAHSGRDGSETAIHLGFAGKYSYVSPEQLGLYGGAITAKSDIYSLGLVLLETASGVKTDMGATPGPATEKRQRLPNLDFVDARFRPLLNRMLEPDPANRPETMLAVAEYIHNLPPSHTKIKARPVGAVAAGLALLTCGAITYLWLAPAPRRQDAAEALSTQTPAKDTNDAKSLSNGPQVGANPAAVNARDRITQFVKNYPTGPCFSITSIGATDGSATIEGLGGSREPFDRLDEAFKAANGFEAVIRARLVAPAQCPALAFFNSWKTDVTSALYIDVSAFVLRVDQPVTGTISNIKDRTVALLLITDDGAVQRVPDFVLADGERRFSLSIERATVSTRSGLLFAIASPQPLSSINSAISLKAERLFPALQTEATAQHERIDVALRYFKVE